MSIIRNYSQFNKDVLINLTHVHSIERKEQTIYFTLPASSITNFNIAFQNEETAVKEYKEILETLKIYYSKCTSPTSPRYDLL